MNAPAINITEDLEAFMRPAKTVMDVSRLGCLYPYPLSFMRFSYVIFAKYLDPNRRSDRVIAEDWDMTVTLCEGRVDAERFAKLKANVPLQEKGRVDTSCFVLSRANKSVRSFEAVVTALAQGQQPNLDEMAKVGYLYRTTAVYGSGKFGMADWDKVKSRWPDFSSPFDAEMFSCWMIRHFSLYQANHVAASRAPDTAVEMDEGIQRYIGIGNATGLGMAPYLINHPLLINNWIEVRELALARVLSQGVADEKSCGYFECLALKAMQHLDEISTDNHEQNSLNAKARADLERALKWFRDRQISAWTDVTLYAGNHLGVEAQELINVLLLELYPEMPDLFLNTQNIVILRAVCKLWRKRDMAKFELTLLIWMFCRYTCCGVSCHFLGLESLIPGHECGCAIPCFRARLLFQILVKILAIHGVFQFARTPPDERFGGFTSVVK